jgi:ABC-type branched-subunit amino acid transport system ATPase component/ABC-type branched-subunit amino acid transport system permease subunit
MVLAAGSWFTQQVLFNGLVQGMVYGLLALSIVLIYRSSKVINFAVGNMGLIGSGLLVILILNWGVPFWLALALGLLVGVVYGALVELIVIRRLFRAPRVIVLVATIGVSQLSLAILSGLPDLEEGRASYPMAIGSSWDIGDVLVKGPQLLVLIVAPLIAAGLAWFLNRTLTGRAVRAAAGNPDLARMSGVNPKNLSTLVWAIGGFVGTAAMILTGGLDGSAANLAALGPVSLLRALVAALIAKFSSFPKALAAGVAIGVGESVLRFHYIDSPGLVDLALLVVVLIVVATSARERADDAVFSFTPKVEAIPERLKGMFWVRNLDRLALMIPLAIAIALPVVFDVPSRQLLYASITGVAIIALSLTVLTGWAGQLSLGQGAFAGIGALVAAAFTRGLVIDWSAGTRQVLYLAIDPLPFGVSILLAGVISAVLAAIVGAGALRVRGLLLAVSTFAFAIAAGSYFYRQDVLSGGNSGTVPFTRGAIFGLDLENQRTYYYVVLTSLVLIMALLGRLRRSGVGRVTVAVRDNATSAAAYTIKPAVAKLRAFALSGAIAGIGGALLAGASQRINFGDARFLVEGSLLLVSMIVIGGMGSIAGAVIGAIWVIGLPTLNPGNEIIPLLSSSLGLLVLLLYFPGGFVHVAYRARASLYRHLEAKLPPLEKATSAPPATLHSTTREPVEHDTPLRAVDISVSYGGVRANDDITLEVRRDEIVGLIGTNGAGKTTLMNAIGGYVPSTGKVELLGHDVSGDQPAVRARKGLGRTFQAATLFPELTVREAVEVACEARGRSSLVETALFSPRARTRARAQREAASELIDFLGLGRYADNPISDLSTGTRRIVELAGLLALDCRVLCLDEPTAGVAQRETEAFGPLILELRRELGASMLVIEHDMPLVMSISDRVYCLETGRVIAEGLPDAMRRDPAVISSYLGTDERAIARSGATPARTVGAGQPR